jgi:hypothetical protein
LLLLRHAYPTVDADQVKVYKPTIEYITYSDPSPTEQLFTLSVGSTSPYYWALSLSGFYFVTDFRISFSATITVVSGSTLQLGVKVDYPSLQIMGLVYFVVQINKESDWFWAASGSSPDVT